jgi:hypothetical protein
MKDTTKRWLDTAAELRDTLGWPANAWPKGIVVTNPHRLRESIRAKGGEGWTGMVPDLRRWENVGLLLELLVDALGPEGADWDFGPCATGWCLFAPHLMEEYEDRHGSIQIEGGSWDGAEPGEPAAMALVDTARREGEVQ